jgi:hypothetical protein
MFALSIFSDPVAGQFKKNQGIILRDTLDGALDVSDFIIHSHGFLPVPFFITEPALGGFGGGLGLVFMKRRPNIIYKRHGIEIEKPTQPDVTGVGALYTLNNTWAGLIFQSGTWIKAKSKYRVVSGYADINLSFYRTTESDEEREFEFNLRTIPIFFSLQRHIGPSAWSAGPSYLFLNTNVQLRSQELPTFLQDKEWNSTVSMPGIIVEMDNRDNIFTPDRGMRFRVSTSWSNDLFGSDYDYVNVDAFFHAYIPCSPKLIAGFRYEVQQVFGDAPFYMLPYMNLRGVPTARYQGNIFSVTEGEVRWDFVPRWSSVFFAGTGKVHDEWSEFAESDWISSAGAGFRYLIARKFKLRMGMDFAKGPEQWTYYFVVGNAWLR